ncbi:MAG TPA: tetratricopeptide repeat protein [Pyrinomonadaceae bacterium]|nr:tetratricopeptide repeat protein [Pyrinomonadaceae bacterium]
MELETQLLDQINDSALSCSERAWMRCDLAKRLEEAGNYDAAREVLGDLWHQLDERPRTKGLDERAAAELLLRVGVLLGWIGSTRQVEGAQERAKDLITKSIRRFEALQERVKTAEALTDLAYCYWREGAFDEARVTLTTARSYLTEQDAYQMGVTLLRLAIVENSTSRHNDALRILMEAEPYAEAGGSDALKGKFRNALAIVLRDLGAAERREDYTDRALIEYAAASFYFEQTGHNRYRACVENNLGFLYSLVGKFAEAHDRLDKARALLIFLKDYVHVAQVDETRAKVLIREGRYAEAERVARQSVEALREGGEQRLLAEALTTHATALARLGRHQQARLTFQRAVAVAEPAGDREGAGHALLAAIEELGEMFTARDLSEMYQRAARLVAQAQNLETLERLNRCALVALRAADPVLAREARGEPEFKPRAGWRDFDFWTEIERYEAYWIERALREAEGVLTRAARLLGFPHHNSLRALLNSRHQDLQHLRTRTRAAPRAGGRRRKRRTAKVTDGRGTEKFVAPARPRPVVLHAEDHKQVAEAVSEILEAAGFRVVTCPDGFLALMKMEGPDGYDLLLFDNDLPGVSGLELARHARRLSHRKQTPIIMLSAGEHEREAREAGVDVFLRKVEDVDAIVPAVERLLRK